MSNTISQQTNGHAPFDNKLKTTGHKIAQQEFDTLIQAEQYVGETWDVDYDSITVQVHDSNRKKAGGIPKGCFLIATRISPGAAITDWNGEDTCAILMRVVAQEKMWNSSEIAKIRAEAGQRATDHPEHWDAEEHMDIYTALAFAYAGLKCRVLGTFYLKQTGPKENEISLILGSDIDNYYPNRGLKVYKPTEKALSRIVNFRDPLLSRDAELAAHEVPFGRVRYTSTDRDRRGLDNVRVSFTPTDLLGQKTSLFGMTRVGKSNTTKIIAKSVFELRSKDGSDGKKGPRVGQLIFDVNGEYANVNDQDNTALINVYKNGGTSDDVVIYGQLKRGPEDKRRITKINFYDTGEMLQVGKALLDQTLQIHGTKGVQYTSSFSAIDFEKPSDYVVTGALNSSTVRFNRTVLAYHVLLKAAGFELPSGLLAPKTTGLFGDITDALRAPKEYKELQEKDPRGAREESKFQKLGQYVHKDDLKGDLPKNFAKAGDIFDKPSPSWAELQNAFTILRSFLKSKTYDAWNELIYVPGSSTQSDWHDARLAAVLDMYGMGAVRILKNALDWHDPNAKSDYVEEIYQHLEKGRLVIVDQGLGSPDLNQQMAERIAWRIFNGNSAKFADGKRAKDMHLIVYIEEAHNLLPSGSDADTKNIWSRMAKEGGKFGIGMVYATQEPSSIQGNILKNTANWFVGHLNNTDEIKEIIKQYDFADFEESILNAEDRGFMRVKTLSNKFTVPVQIDKFEILEDQKP